MNAILARYDAMSVGECPFTPDRATVVDYVSSKQKRLNMVFQFDAVDVGQGKVFKYGTTPFNYKLVDLKDAIVRTQGLLNGTDAWTTSFIENHDQARSISRFGDDSLQWRERSGKMLAMLFSSLSGTLFVYQGQEIGMINMPPSWSIDEYKDVDSKNYYGMVAERSKFDPKRLSDAHASLQHLARDHARTPMQWTASRNGGFADERVVPWMRVNTSTLDGVNVAQQTADKTSVLAFWRHMLQLRKSNEDTFVDGAFELIDRVNEQVFSYVKHGPQRSTQVSCNFSGRCGSSPVYPTMRRKQLLLSNVGGLVTQSDDDGVLQPWEGRIYVLT